MQSRMILWIGAMLLFGPIARSAATMPVAYCMECTEPTQLLMSAVAAFGHPGAAVRADRALVVNPDVPQVVAVDLVAAPDGKGMLAKPAPMPSPDAVKAALDAADAAPIFVPSCHGVVQVGPGAKEAVLGPPRGSGGGGRPSAAASAGAVERGTLVDLGHGVYGLVLCHGGAFAGYQRHDQAALTRAIRVATLRRAMDLPGAVKVVGRPDTAGGPPPKPMWHPGEVCAVFNDGSSACYGKPPSSAPGASQGMTVINHGGRVAYGAPGSEQGGPGPWLTCDLEQDLVSGCAIAQR